MLAWHVDYWDRLGWKDTFGSKTFTQRQKSYGMLRRIRQMATPQLIIGNREPTRAEGGWRSIKTKVDKGSAAKPIISINGSVKLSEDGKKILGKFTLERLDKTAKIAETVKLLPILYQKRATTDCSRGENRGKKLIEVFPVRKMLAGQALKFEKDGHSVEVDMPKGVKTEQLGIAILIEDTPKLTTIECRAFDVEAKKTEKKEEK